MAQRLNANIIAAIILVLIIILGALGIRSGLLVGVSIPGSWSMLEVRDYGDAGGGAVLFCFRLAFSGFYPKFAGRRGLI